MNNYQNSKIYKIKCNITNQIYIGSTYETLEERLRRHKLFKDCMCRNIIDRGDYEMILIKDYPCNSKEELLWEERRHIENNICINKIKRPIITEEEDKQRRKIYQDNNKDKQKIYQDRHREKKNKKAAERINCPICNLELRRDSLNKHTKRKHSNNI